jgi:hypothetical protein
MVKASFEHEGNSGLLTVETHFNKTIEIACEKRDDEKFRLGGTAINEVIVYEGFLLRLPEDPLHSHFRAFRSEEIHFESTGVLSPEEWDVADLHCYVTEYYSLDMEGQAPGWFISKAPISDSHYLFVNMDITDGGGNVVKRYRISPFTGEYKVMEGLHAQSN